MLIVCSYVMAKQEADHGGCNDAVLLNEAGQVVEFTSQQSLCGQGRTSCLRRRWSTVRLPGITRGVVLELAAKLGVPVEETSFGTELFAEADEVFATNSLLEIEPVAEVDGAQFHRHHVVMQLHDAYRDLVREELSLCHPERSEGPLNRSPVHASNQTRGLPSHNRRPATVSLRSE